MSPLWEGHKEERRWSGAFLEGQSEHSHRSLLLTLNLWQKSRKQGAGKTTWVSPGNTSCHEGAQALLPQCPSLQESWGVTSKVWVSRDSLRVQVAPAAVLEADDDVCDLQVPLLQVGQHASLEEDLALADAVQVYGELQGFDPEDESRLLTMGPPRSPGTTKARGGAWSRGWPCWSVGSLLLVQGHCGVGGRQEGADGGQQGAGQESDSQRNAETQP